MENSQLVTTLIHKPKYIGHIEYTKKHQLFCNSTVKVETDECFDDPIKVQHSKLNNSTMCQIKVEELDFIDDCIKTVNGKLICNVKMESTDNKEDKRLIPGTVKVEELEDCETLRKQCVYYVEANKAEAKSGDSYQFEDNQEGFAAFKPERKLFECDLCVFKANKKQYLKKHMLVHRDSSELKWFKCNACDYKTKYKICLTKHELVHKDSSDIEWFECPTCDYKSKYRGHLNVHMLTHKDPSQIHWWKCDSCDYKSKHKCNLKKHVKRVHGNLPGDPSQVKWLRCDMCYYITKSKTSLTNHMLVHKSAAEITWFRCDLCPFKGKLKSSLKHHMVKHKQDVVCVKNTVDGDADMPLKQHFRTTLLLQWKTTN
ncbi:hypothetical protein NQ315_007382 [Exocentrus adspersus]|uniref:C2H2-type domain-containing protein n=1 Tax=Exocentrus adspersus TaxID=1586481 RepID=A0AAV8VHQ6_9CUCU|nr:hypothetical protein NQ315_007382 [Exocentrus adspersus]